MLKFLCVFLCNSLFHEMKSNPPEQTNTAPAFHIHSQGRANNYSASEAQLYFFKLLFCLLRKAKGR